MAYLFLLYFIINGDREENDGVVCLCFGIFKVSLLQSVRSHVVQKNVKDVSFRQE